MSHFKAPQELSVPVAAKHSFEQTYHGVTTQDNYHWLRADNWQEAMREPEKLPADITAYLEAENAYFKAAMADTEDLQKALVEEMRGRMKEDESGVPEKCDQYAYNTRYNEGSEHPLMVRTPRDGLPNGAKEEVLLDANIEAEGKDYFELGTTEVSPNHTRLAWSCDVNGSEYFELSIRDLSTGKDLDYTLADVESVAWGDEDTLFYSRVDEHHHPGTIYRHRIGTDPKEDVLIMQEKDTRFRLAVDRLLSGAYLVLSNCTIDSDEHWLIPTADLKAEPRVIQPKQEGLEYSVEHQDDQLFIVTNADGAEDFKIVSAPIDAPQKENWVDVIPHQQGRMVLGHEVYKDWLIWMERENALPCIKMRDKTGAVSTISFDEEAYAIGLDPSLEYDSHSIRYSYSSPTTPSRIYDYDLNTGERELRKETEIPSGHNPDDYVTKRLMAKSHDGAMVPITLLYHKSTALDGTAPCLLYGYGSYGSSMPASFSTTRLSLVDRGFIYAIAHIRGGEEKGRAWYESAKGAGKPNSFHDFIAVGEYLAKESYTKEGNIVCQGGSAGGLLVGAAVNMKPSLFAGVIAQVPFVDVLNTILDDTLPLTPGEWTQWGNPIESKDAYGWIASYSPYDNVQAKDYPAFLITAGVSDPRVTYWEPAKWAAKLRELKTDDNVLMLKTNMTSGHYGTTGRFAALEDVAQAYAFALKVVGLA